MIEFVKCVLDPYLAAAREELRGRRRVPSPKAILLLDSWSVHRGPFLSWLNENHPDIIPLFVPAGRTSVFQPADVGLNKPFQSSMRRAFHLYMFEELYGAIQREEDAVAFAMDRKGKVLRNLSSRWMTAAWSWLAGMS